MDFYTIKNRRYNRNRKRTTNNKQKIPFKVRYSGNYLWQIYYSEEKETLLCYIQEREKYALQKNIMTDALFITERK